MTGYIGAYLGHYKILGHLGSGAMSDVYLGYDEERQLHVAVKVVNEAVAARRELIERFKREAQAAARLNHPNVARVYYFDFRGDAPFYAMELVEGVSLADVLERRMRISLRQFLDVFEQAARGLRAAAVRGITHRDVKPGNLMVGRDGLVKVVDFGLAKVDGGELTETGTMFGTPFYLSPEAVRGDPTDLRSDIYSLGVTMFQLLVGYAPFDADTTSGLMMQHVDAPTPHPSELNEQLPRPLGDLIARAMARAPEDRFPNYEALLNALAAVRERLIDRLDDELQFCARCDANTIARGERCSRCVTPREGSARPEVFDLFVTAFRDADALEASTRALAEVVGRRPEIVRRALVQLPFKLGHRLPAERARRLQARFGELGAEVELRPAPTQASGDEPGRLEFVSAVMARTASLVAPVPRSLARRRRERLVRRAAVIALPLVVLVAGGLLVAHGVRSARRAAAEHDERATAPAEPVLPDAAVANARGGADGGAAAGAEDGPPLLDVQRIGDLDPAVADEATAAVERAIAHVEAICGSRPDTPRRIVLDGTHPFRSDDDPRAWETELRQPPERFPLDGLAADDPGVDIAAAHWVARAVVADHAGPDAPGWVALGLAYLAEARAVGLDPAPFEALAREESRIPVTFWGALQGRNPPENIARAESMVEYLIEREGAEAFRAFLDALREVPAEQAFTRAFGADSAAIQRSWEEFLAVRYGTITD